MVDHIFQFEIQGIRCRKRFFFLVCQYTNIRNIIPFIVFGRTWKNFNSGFDGICWTSGHRGPLFFTVVFFILLVALVLITLLVLFLLFLVLFLIGFVFFIQWRTWCLRCGIFVVFCIFMMRRRLTSCCPA